MGCLDSYPLPRKGTETFGAGTGGTEVTGDSYPLPRKGTETEQYQSETNSAPGAIHTHYPARGRKHVVIGDRQ